MKSYQYNVSYQIIFSEALQSVVLDNIILYMVEMYRWLLLCAVVVGAWSASTRVQIVPPQIQGQGQSYSNYNDFLKKRDNEAYSINALDTLKNIGQDKPKYKSLGDIKKNLANGDVQQILDNIPELIEKYPVKVRTVWLGEKTPSKDDAEFSVKNTVNIDAYKGEKSKLHLILDSKFRQNGENIEVLDPSVQLQFQVKY